MSRAVMAFSTQEENNKNITDANNFNSAQLAQLPCLSNRERAIRIHLGFMDEPFAVGIS
jgi:hypothetical protein